VSGARTCRRHAGYYTERKESKDETDALTAVAELEQKGRLMGIDDMQAPLPANMPYCSENPFNK